MRSGHPWPTIRDMSTPEAGKVMGRQHVSRLTDFDPWRTWRTVTTSPLMCVRFVLWLHRNRAWHTTLNISALEAGKEGHGEAALTKVQRFMSLTCIKHCDLTSSHVYSIYSLVRWGQVEVRKVMVEAAFMQHLTELRPRGDYWCIVGGHEDQRPGCLLLKIGL